MTIKELKERVQRLESRISKDIKNIKTDPPREDFLAGMREALQFVLGWMKEGK